MGKYNTFLTLFIVATIAFLFFMGFYIGGFFLAAAQAFDKPNPDPFEMFRLIFSVKVIVAFIIAATASLINRIFGIVIVAKNKTISDGEKALWIIGFVLLSFVTSIVFLIMAKGKKLVE
jgi:hypothetical protein